VNCLEILVNHSKRETRLFDSISSVHFPFREPSKLLRTQTNAKWRFILKKNEECNMTLEFGRVWKVWRQDICETYRNNFECVHGPFSLNWIGIANNVTRASLWPEIMIVSQIIKISLIWNVWNEDLIALDSEVYRPIRGNDREFRERWTLNGHFPWRSAQNSLFETQKERTCDHDMYLLHG
jgi:hypothetical protein